METLETLFLRLVVIPYALGLGPTLAVWCLAGGVAGYLLGRSDRKG